MTNYSTTTQVFTNAGDAWAYAVQHHYRFVPQTNDLVEWCLWHAPPGAEHVIALPWPPCALLGFILGWMLGRWLSNRGRKPGV